MRHFLGETRGDSGTSILSGTRESGILGHIRGINIGASVEIHHECGMDIVKVYKTGGSNCPYSRELVAEFTE